MGILDEVQAIDMEGFQVVSSEMFCGNQRTDSPAITLWHDQISFSKSAVNALNNCERVRMEVNIRSKKILLVPVTSKDKDGIRWSKTGKDSHGRKLECRPFSEKIYQEWKWEPEYVYRASGRIVVFDQKVMLLFDFSNAVSWLYGSRAKVQEK